MPTSYVRPMTLGELLDRAFQLYRRNFVPMFVACLVVLVPAGVLSATINVGMNPATEAIGGYLLGALLMVFLVGIAWIAVTWQVDEVVQGRGPDVTAALRSGLRLALPLLLLWILVYVLMIVAIVPPIVVGGVGSAAASFLPEGVTRIAGLAAVGALSLALAAVTITWAGSIAAVAVPALVAERLGPLAAMLRARELAKGGRLKVVGAALIAWLLSFAPVAGLLVLLGLGFGFWDPEALDTMTTGQLYLQQALQLGTGALTTPLFAAILVMTYYDRRARREGYDVELAASELQG